MPSRFIAHEVVRVLVHPFNDRIRLVMMYCSPDNIGFCLLRSTLTADFVFFRFLFCFAFSLKLEHVTAWSCDELNPRIPHGLVRSRFMGVSEHDQKRTYSGCSGIRFTVRAELRYRVLRIVQEFLLNAFYLDLVCSQSKIHFEAIWTPVASSLHRGVLRTFNTGFSLRVSSRPCP